MYEKVTPKHPDKLADRIAGALVDYAYTKEDNPRIAVEVLIGHGRCLVITETSVPIPLFYVQETVERIAEGDIVLEYVENAQDVHLSYNQIGEIKCGDNGIFKGVPVTQEQKDLTKIARDIYARYASDGKYILADDRLIICQSNASAQKLSEEYVFADINPLGDWTGGINVDSGATNRKLGSDMGDSVTGGGLHGKDLSKADVSVNIYAWLVAQQTGKEVKMCCAIGDTEDDGRKYSDIVEIARKYIKSIGGFERFAEWGLIR